MDVREKLVELIKRFCSGLPVNDIEPPYGYENLADYLISSGVTVRGDKDMNVPTNWISVKDRLPDRNDMVIAFYPTMRGTSGEMQIHKAWAMSETCTHWQYLPQPPKGE